MGSSRFDDLTRSFTLPSRRSVVSALAAAVLTALIDRENADALAKRKRHKQKHRRQGADAVRASGRGKMKGRKKNKKRSAPTPATNVPPPPLSPACPAGQKACGDGCIANDACCAACGQGTTCRNGQCVATCVQPTDCPVPTRACAQPTCVDGACGLEPKSARTVCRPTAGSCDVADVCDGSALDCPPDAFQPSSVVCRSAGCVDADTAQLGTTCSGTSTSCPAPVHVECYPYHCDPGGTGCGTFCTEQSHCATDAYCDCPQLNNCQPASCVPKKANGQSCSWNGACASSRCVGGICCNRLCSAVPNATGSCATGTCTYTCHAGFADCNGDLNTGGNINTGCETHLMADDLNCGVCGSICNGQCGPNQEQCINGECVCTG